MFPLLPNKAFLKIFPGNLHYLYCYKIEIPLTNYFEYPLYSPVGIYILYGYLQKSRLCRLKIGDFLNYPCSNNFTLYIYK